jgi:tRNA-Thr(GGU) m(6)t(6)A37 methyltransferase TsaA
LTGIGVPEFRPIGVVRSPHRGAEGTPIQGVYDQSEGVVEILPEFGEGLKDLEGFSRIWILYAFHRGSSARLRVVPFRDIEERGIFATRSPCRPNAIGMTSVELVKVDGARVHFRGVDVIDGTPVLDIKPYVHQWDSFEKGREGWLDSSVVERTVADDRFSRAAVPLAKDDK